MTLAQALRQMGVAHGKLQTLKKQFAKERTFYTSQDDVPQSAEALAKIAPNRPAINLDLIGELQQRIGQLKIRIQLTNVNTRVTYQGQECTLAELLLLLNDMKERLSLLRQLCVDATQEDRYGYHDREGKELLLDYDVDEYREKRDALIDEIADLDTFVQQVNFNTSLAE